MIAESEAPQVAPVGPGRASWGRLSAVLLVSTILIAVSMALASRGEGSLHFAIFWLGVLLGFAGIAHCLLRVAEQPRDVVEVLTVLGVWGMIPRLLRTGLTPVFFDEFDHLRIAQDFTATGHTSALNHLFQIGSSFPGLELLTATTAFVSPLSLWHSGLAWVTVAHVLGIIGFYALVSQHRSSCRQGALAGLFYACNPSWFYFHAQFSYETLALPLMIWALVFAERFHREEKQRATLGAFIVLCAALSIVHHATAAALIGILLLWTLASAGVDLLGKTHRIKPSTYRIGTACALAGALVIVRLLLVGPTLWHYWAPVLNVSTLTNAFGRLFGHAGAGGGRSVFSGTQLPWFEIAAGFLLVPLLMVILGRSLLQRWRSSAAIDGLEITFWLLSLAFFVSLPLDLVSSLSEAAHRSWGFSFLGLAAAAASVAEPMLTQQRTWKVMTAGAVFAVIAVAGTSVGTSINYQFPGPNETGADGRSLNNETALVASWFSTHTTSRDRVFVDRFVSRQILLATKADVVMPWQLWQLAYFPVLNDYTLRMIRTFKVNYFVFDRRMTTVFPPAGFWYSASEPPEYLSTLVPASNLDRFNCYDWAKVVATTEHYEIVAVDRVQAAIDERRKDIGVIPGCPEMLAAAK